MRRHRLTLAERIRGTRAAINSPKTPMHLRKALERHLSDLQEKLTRKNEPPKEKSLATKRSGKVGLLDWLHL